VIWLACLAAMASILGDAGGVNDIGAELGDLGGVLLASGAAPSRRDSFFGQLWSVLQWLAQQGPQK